MTGRARPRTPRAALTGNIDVTGIDMLWERVRQNKIRVVDGMSGESSAAHGMHPSGSAIALRRTLGPTLDKVRQKAMVEPRSELRKPLKVGPATALEQGLPGRPS